MILKELLRNVSLKQECRVTHINNMFKDYEGTPKYLEIKLDDLLLEEISGIYVKDNKLIILI